jgi:hypothetical protein
MIGTFVMIVAKACNKRKSFGNVLSARTIFYVNNAIRSLFTNIHWKKVESQRDLEPQKIVIKH